MQQTSSKINNANRARELIGVYNNNLTCVSPTVFVRDTNEEESIIIIERSHENEIPLTAWLANTKVTNASKYIILAQMCFVLEEIHSHNCPHGNLVSPDVFRVRASDTTVVLHEFDTDPPELCLSMDQRKAQDKRMLHAILHNIAKTHALERFMTKISSWLVTETLASVGQRLLACAIDTNKSNNAQSLESLRNNILATQAAPLHFSINGVMDFDAIVNTLRVMYMYTIKHAFTLQNANPRIVYSHDVMGDGPERQIMSHFFSTCIQRGIISAPTDTQPMLPLEMTAASGERETVNIYHIVGFAALYCVYNNVHIAMPISGRTMRLLTATPGLLGNAMYLSCTLGITKRSQSKHILDMITGAIPYAYVLREFDMSRDGFMYDLMASEHGVAYKSLTECVHIDDASFTAYEKQQVAQWIRGLSPNDERVFVRLVTGCDKMSTIAIRKTTTSNDPRIQTCSAEIYIPQSYFENFQEIMQNYLAFSADTANVYTLA